MTTYHLEWNNQRFCVFKKSIDFLVLIGYNQGKVKFFIPDKDSDFVKELVDEICDPLLHKTKVRTLRDMTRKEIKKLEKEYGCKITKEKK